MNGVALMASTTHALRGERVLKQAGLNAKLIPTPRELSSDCGLALRFAWGERERVAALLGEAGIDYTRLMALE